MRELQIRSGVLLAMGTACLLLMLGCPNDGEFCDAALEQCGTLCVDPNIDKGNCGGCGIACGALQVCTGGTCGCREGTVDCAGSCVEVANNDSNCGACGTACGAGEACADSVCVPTQTCGGAICGADETCVGGTTCECAGDLVRCGDACVDLSTSPGHCGACDAACATGQSCVGSTCT